MIECEKRSVVWEDDFFNKTDLSLVCAVISLRNGAPMAAGEVTGG